MTIENLSKQFDSHHTEVKAKLEENSVELRELKQRLSGVEQGLVEKGRRGRGGVAETAGNLVINSPEFAALAKSRSGRANIEMKTTITSGSTSGGPLSTPDRRGPDMMPQRELRVRDLLAPGQTSAGLVEYPRQTTRTNNAATVAEGASKPESALAWELVQAPVRTVAHWIPASKQIFDDAPQLMSLVDGELTYGLADVEENQLLNGSGTGEDLNGVYTQATAYAAPFVPTGAGNMQKLDVLLMAMAQVGASKFKADGMVLNPYDWADIMLLKTDDGAYLGSGPFTADDVARLWRTPVVTTESMTVNKFLVGAFKRGGQIFDRQTPTVEISTEHSDYFTRNLIAIRAEQRLALAVYRPLAFVKGDFTEALAA